MKSLKSYITESLLNEARKKVTDPKAQEWFDTYVHGTRRGNRGHKVLKEFPDGIGLVEKEYIEKTGEKLLNVYMIEPFGRNFDKIIDVPDNISKQFLGENVGVVHVGPVLFKDEKEMRKILDLFHNAHLIWIGNIDVSKDGRDDTWSLDDLIKYCKKLGNTKLWGTVNFKGTREEYQECWPIFEKEVQKKVGSEQLYFCYSKYYQ